MTVPTKYELMRAGGKGSFQCKSLPINFCKAYPDLQKEKGIHKWAGIGVTRGKKSGAA